MRELIQEEKIVKTNSDTSLEDEALQLIEKGYNKSQIRKELHIGQKTLVSILSKMRTEGKLSEDFFAYSKRRELQLLEKDRKDKERAVWIEQRASELMAQGCNRQKISRELHVSYSELNPIIDKIIIRWEKEKNDEGNRVIDSNSDVQNKKDYVPNSKETSHFPQ